MTDGVDGRRVRRWRALLTLGLGVALAASAQTPPDGAGFVTHDGVRIWYRVEGAGNAAAIPILLIHGGPGATARPFEKTIGPELAKARTVVYMDNRGAGRSDRPTEPSRYSFDLLAGDADAIRRHLKIERWAVFGHSNGAATAITYATKYRNAQRRSCSAIPC